mmetsp:Transcript_12978/g.51951  ORF Transcript_12978/g.51951 Transcript_12978/m.51951 type:complete len:204 (+) Transcript_12978:684-1295(+)
MRDVDPPFAEKVAVPPGVRSSRGVPGSAASQVERRARQRATARVLVARRPVAAHREPSRSRSTVSKSSCSRSPARRQAPRNRFTFSRRSNGPRHDDDVPGEGFFFFEWFASSNARAPRTFLATAHSATPSARLDARSSSSSQDSGASASAMPSASTIHVRVARASAAADSSTWTTPILRVIKDDLRTPKKNDHARSRKNRGRT